MSNDALNYLRHIQDEIDFIISTVDDSVEKVSFINDETLKRAVVRSLEIIGEATKKIPQDQKAEWIGIEWKNMAGMRDRLIHDYMGINYNIVWDVIKNKIPDLKINIDKIIEDERLNS